MKIEFTSDDLEAIRLIIREEIEKSKKPQEELLTRDQVCEKLGIEISTYHRQVKQGKIKVRKVGNKVALTT